MTNEMTDEKTTEKGTPKIDSGLPEKTSPKLLRPPFLTIMKRELGAYFSSPIAYIIIVINIVLLSLTFFKGLFLNYNFFLYKSSDMRIMFLFQSVLLTLFIPILTMRLYSEEKRSMSLETLITLPVTEIDIALGKSLAAFITSLAVALPSVFFPILISLCGTLDTNQIISGYIGLVLIAALFTSIGVFASSRTAHQIVSLFVSLPVCAILMSVYVPFTIPKNIPAAIDSLFKFLSTYEHFKLISRGMLDLRSIVYFVSLISFFFTLTVIFQKRDKE